MNSCNPSDLLPERQERTYNVSLVVNFSPNKQRTLRISSKQIHSGPCLFNVCVCTIIFPSCWGGRRNPSLGNSASGRGAGKKLGRLPQRVNCNEANKIQASLSQEVPILDRRAPLNIKNPKVKLSGDESLVLFLCLCPQRHFQTFFGE